MRIDERVLNRVTLARQLLVERSSMSVPDAVGHMVGLQAQAVNAPYLGLWTRLAGFELSDLTVALEDRSVVRSSMLRGTQHLVCAADYGWLRPLVAPVLARGRQAAFGKQTPGIDVDELVVRARELLAGRTLTRPQLGAGLAERWPEFDPLVLGWSAQCLVQVVHPPPSGTWRRGGSTPFMLATDWLGPLGDGRGPEELVRRYLAAFGPATVADMQLWSGVRGLAEVVEEMDLVRLTGDLYDLPDMSYEVVDEVPVRLVPDFDNLMVAYADRTRIMSDDYRKRVCVGALVAATVLVGGMVRGTWKLALGKGTASLTVTLFERLSRVDQAAVAAEAERLLAFVGAGDRQLIWV